MLAVSTINNDEIAPVLRRSTDLFYASLRSEEEIRAEILKARKVLAHFEGRREKAIEAGDLHKAKRLAHVMMRSYPCRLAAL